MESPDGRPAKKPAGFEHRDLFPPPSAPKGCSTKFMDTSARSAGLAGRLFGLRTADCRLEAATGEPCDECANSAQRAPSGSPTSWPTKQPSWPPS